MKPSSLSSLLPTAKAVGSLCELPALSVKHDPVHR